MMDRFSFSQKYKSAPSDCRALREGQPEVSILFSEYFEIFTFNIFHSIFEHSALYENNLGKSGLRGQVGMLGSYNYIGGSGAFQ